MAQDPLSHVASWLIPASDKVADEAIGRDVIAARDPLLALIAEHKRLEVEDDELWDALPEDVRRDFALRYVDLGEDAVKAFSRVCDQMRQIEKRISITPAISPAGLVAQLEFLEKASIATACGSFEAIIAGVKALVPAGGDHDAQMTSEDDSKILSLFREWMDAQRAGQSLSADEPEESHAAVERHLVELLRAITDLPAEGAKGLAIKNYLAAHMGGIMCGGGDDAAAIPSDVWKDADFEKHEDARLERAILKDAVRFVPELAPLAAAALDPPATDVAAGPDVIVFGEPEEGGAA
jgi:hypothetical protein